MLKILLLVPLLAASAFAQSGPPATRQPTRGFPHLQRNGQAVQLMVDSVPFLVLGGELHNSSASSLAYMDRIWPRLTQMHLNTVLAAVSWGEIEQDEGRFDFTVVDGLLRDARRNDLKLVLLWFGSWKNGLSHYAPVWVKRDVARFPRARLASGAPEVLSTLSETNRDADARAFAAFMRHLRAVDGAQHTVLMIQVENEVGLLGDSRDRSAAANAAFSQAVPRELLAYLETNRASLLPELRTALDATGKRAGTWTEVFGANRTADEVFMAWNYARYLNRIAAAGKAEYPLPMFVNAWIVQPQDTMPGDYPSGGPQAHVHDIWKAGAPSIDILAPDIYLPDFRGITARYQRSGTPLFIPESRAGAEGAANAFFAVGARAAIGYSPFGIESVDSNAAATPIAKAYAVLRQLAPLILRHQASGTIAGIALTTAAAEQRISLNGYELVVTLRAGRRGSEAAQSGYGVVIATGPDEFIVAGSNLQVTFAPAGATNRVAGLATVDEGQFVAGKWIAERRLNGDEIMVSYNMAALAAARQTGTGLRFGADPTVQRVALYQYE
ncbi:MAG: DUF5597 domain-containing protein [Gammaproteobacteria bacterium]